MEVKNMRDDRMYENDLFETRLGDEQPKVSGKPYTGVAANAKYVRVRKGPSGSAQVVAVMTSGEGAEILEKIKGYYKIRTNRGNHIGYVASNYFRED